MKPSRAKTVRVEIREEFGWRHFRIGETSVWVKGYGIGANAHEIARALASHSGVDSLSRWLSGIEGHFAFVAATPSMTLASVDRVRSIPLAYARCGQEWCIDDQALRLRNRAGLSCRDVNRDAVLSVAMSGYTIDNTTLYSGLEQIGPGEFVLFADNEAPRRHRYYCYRPWRADKPDYDFARAKSELADATLSIIEDTIKGLGGRELVVPLSAGRDSRLIVSAARHLGYRNVRCFAYGRLGNFEAKASQAIAEKLGYKWRFVPTSVNFMRRYFKSEVHARYLTYSDSTQSTPFEQDLPQIQQLKDNGYIPPDAVLCNGNTGDYISGAHVVPDMQIVSSSLSQQARMQRIIDALIGKHFALWRSLMTAANRAQIARQLSQSFAHAGAPLGESENDYGVYEYAEFQNRQCKYVISGQRVYDFLGHDWRLPLWASRYLDFWEGIPLVGKAKQHLYASMLEDQNWGGVWREMPVNAKTIRPDWIRPIRFAAKLAHAPLGAVRWHKFERRFFQYWMSATGVSGVVSYARAAMDRRGARNEVSWLTEAYLGHHLPQYPE